MMAMSASELAQSGDRKNQIILNADMFPVLDTDCD